MQTEEQQAAVEEAGVEDTLVELGLLEQEETGTGPVSKAQDPMTLLHKHHPESILDYQESVLQKLSLKSIPPDSSERPDPTHKSQPFLTQYEKTRILGFRSNQLAQGARPFIPVPSHVTSTLEIARMELAQRMLPFIIKRPMPDGTFEYWRLADLMIL
jgi:DNA-directed RNA polymerase subunit K/omega